MLALVPTVTLNNTTTVIGWTTKSNTDVSSAFLKSSEQTFSTSGIRSGRTQKRRSALKNYTGCSAFSIDGCICSLPIENKLKKDAGAWRKMLSGDKPQLLQCRVKFPLSITHEHKLSRHASITQTIYCIRHAPETKMIERT